MARWRGRRGDVRTGGRAEKKLKKQLFAFICFWALDSRFANSPNQIPKRRDLLYINGYIYIYIFI